MNVVLWPIGNVIPYPRNARQIPPSAIDKVAASIQEFGFRQPIVVDKQGVIVGSQNDRSSPSAKSRG
jgi:site-specific DNA-methyltransferase (adenine-specific)